MAESYAVNGLLLGIVAARRRQISAEQFVMAMQAWILDSSQSLGEILESHGLLSAESRHQLADAIQANLAAHDNDPRHLLAETMQAAEQADDDVGTRTEREHSTRTVAAEATSGPDHVTQPMLPDMPDETELQFTLELRSSQRFHILRPHARGGLGEVYVAEDRELNREVALKEIQPRHADDANSRQRFIMEAEITGGLEHPGIVPVYGLGHHEDGRPYYAMRFIRGENLKEAIGHFHETCRADPTQRSLLLRQLLRRFIDACNAVAYAHSRGVLHRDLKPGNVMLGEFGETLVVDWGLAKAVGRAQSAPELADDAEATLQPRLTDVEDATQTGQIMGTPAYMSPEQAAGRVSQMTARSDVYSLGAILYTLLTNQSPYAGDRSAILQDVQAGRLIPPQKVHADVPRSLAAVCQKAMAVLPSDRYATPQALAADVELWLAGEPNSAYRETMLERGVRISRRHKSLLTAAAALLLTTVLALGIGLQAVSAEQRKTRQERDDKELALRSEEKQRQYAEKLLLQNTIVLFRLTDDVLKQLISRQVAITSSERRFLANLETMYGELTSASGETVAAKHNRVAGLIRLANVRLQLGEADSARDGFSEAIEILNGLLAKDPTNVDSQDLLARTWKGVAGLEFGIGNLAQAEKAVQRSCDLFGKLAQKSQEDSVLHNQLAESQNTLGLVLAQRGKTEPAAALYRQLMVTRRRYLKEHPDDIEFLNNHAILLNNYSVILNSQGQTADAEKVLRERLAISETLYRDSPESPQHRFQVAQAQHNLAFVERQQGKTTEAERGYRAAIANLELLVADFPGAPMYRVSLGSYYNNLGMLLKDKGKLDEAEQVYGNGIALQLRLASSFPDMPTHREHLSNSQDNLGAVLMARGQLPAAERALRDALEVRTRLVVENPTIPRYRVNQGNSLGNLANLLRDTQRPAEAEPLYRQAIDVQQALANEFPMEPLRRADLANTHNNLANLLSGMGSIADAEVAYRQAIAVLVPLCEEYANAPDFRESLADTRQNLAIDLQGTNRLADATEELRQVVELRTLLANQFANEARYALSLARSLSFYSDLLSKTADLEGAKTQDQQAIAILTKLQSENRSNLEIANQLASTLTHLASLHHSQGQHAEARQLLDQALPLHESNLKTAPDDLGSKQLRQQTLLVLLPTLLAQGEHVTTVEHARSLRDHPVNSAVDCYNAACFILRAADLVKSGNTPLLPAVPEDQRDLLITTYADEGMSLLQHAIAAGFKDLKLLESDPDLTLLRDRDDFKTLIQGVQEAAKTQTP